MPSIQRWRCFCPGEGSSGGGYGPCLNDWSQILDLANKKPPGQWAPGGLDQRRVVGHPRLHRHGIGRPGDATPPVASYGNPETTASVPSGPRQVGRWPVLTQIVQPSSLQGRCTLPGGFRSQLPEG